MKHLTEYRDGALVRRVLDDITRESTRPAVLMEVCGGQTHSFVRSGLDRMLPETITLVHGPGCPVCVTPLEVVDRALALARRPEVIFTSFGDMLRVPGTDGDLFSVRAAGGDVRVVYSPLDAVTIAAENPDREVVFFAIGFETTAPANAMSVAEAKRQGLPNYSVLVSHACVPGAMRAILGDSHNRVQAFLAAGHVCAVMGYHEYPPIAREFEVPIVVTGFEPVDLAHGVLTAVRQLESGRAEVENAYGRVVSEVGNVEAQVLINEVFELGDRVWRGIGMIPASGLHLRDAYRDFDACARFDVGAVHSEESARCIAGEILQGRRKPTDCAAFGTECTPENPLGATMVSSEGACAAYYRYERGPVCAGRVP
ncbi:MAG: hydrogenase formation protein HypD [Phycisphaerales bacterium]|nr:hydrogenase formation protein HypD [Phycisphaerae bacterium]NNF43405.1 hydrogenase formation protein HypD [Phycisphaerales bacterium]NNM26737.1 hydrogenase formation protein HypD [Phycisphaerales bacterium]